MKKQANEWASERKAFITTLIPGRGCFSSSLPPLLPGYRMWFNKLFIASMYTPATSKSSLTTFVLQKEDSDCRNLKDLCTIMTLILIYSTASIRQPLRALTDLLVDWLINGIKRLIKFNIRISIHKIKTCTVSKEPLHWETEIQNSIIEQMMRFSYSIFKLK